MHFWLLKGAKLSTISSARVIRARDIFTGVSEKEEARFGIASLPMVASHAKWSKVGPKRVPPSLHQVCTKIELLWIDRTHQSLSWTCFSSSSSSLFVFTWSWFHLWWWDKKSLCRVDCCVKCVQVFKMSDEPPKPPSDQAFDYSGASPYAGYCNCGQENCPNPSPWPFGRCLLLCIFLFEGAFTLGRYQGG